MINSRGMAKIDENLNTFNVQNTLFLNKKSQKKLKKLLQKL